MKFFGFILCGSSLGLFLLTGCNSLPAGTPPDGEIVAQDNITNIYSSASAVNYLITSLSAFAVKNVPQNSTIAQQFDAPDKSLNFYPEKVYKTVAGIAKLNKVPAEGVGDFRLISCIKNVKGDSNILIWEMTLIHTPDSVKVWSETIKIDQSKQE